MDLKRLRELAGVSQLNEAKPASKKLAEAAQPAPVFKAIGTTDPIPGLQRTNRLFLPLRAMITQRQKSQTAGFGLWELNKRFTKPLRTMSFTF